MSLWSFKELSCWFNKFIILLFCALPVFNVKLFVCFLSLSALVGEKLVDLFLVAYNLLHKLLESTLLGLQVIKEDAVIFLNDAQERINSCIILIHEFCLHVQNIYYFVYWVGQISLNLALQALYFLMNLLRGTGEVIITLCLYIQSLGVSLWTSFLSIPHLVIDCIALCMHEIMVFFRESTNQVLYLSKYYGGKINNVEVEGVLGLVIGTCLLAGVCLKFKYLCATFLYITLKSYNFATQLSCDIFHKIISLSNFSYKIQNRKFEDDRLCVICEDQPREIIILPCKHFCICSNCSTALAVRQLNCPLCRSHISNTIKVYW